MSTNVLGTVLLASIPILISLYSKKYQEDDLIKVFPNDPSNFGLPVKQEFDFIIVGGGAAGCVLGSILSKQYTVLIVEAGGNPPPLQSVPFLWENSIEIPDIHFIYRTLPQSNTRLENGGILTLTTGRMLGGSSSHNAMTYERGHAKDYDRFALVTDDDSWKYDNILKYFLKSENYTGLFNLSKDHHGQDGPVQVTEDSYSPGSKIWLEAGLELGYSIVDSNAPQSDGFSYSLRMKRGGHRESMYTAYIKPIEKTRKNLTIYRYSNVSQVIFENKKAIGVHFTRHGVPQVAFCRKEVILSAGALATPLILIKSGIGSLDQLVTINSKPISILPGVGQNLVDHPFIKLAPIYINDSKFSWNLETNLTFNDVEDFIHHGKGPLSSGSHGSMTAFITSKEKCRVGQSNCNWPDLQIYYSYVGIEPNSVAIGIGINNPQSRGSLTFNKNLDPLINLNFFQDEQDLQVGVEGINLCLKIIENTTSFQNIGAYYIEKPYEPCQHHIYRSVDYWKCYIRFTSTSTAHIAGTCKMGKKGDPMAVVDSKLRVIGVEKLRVVDSSIMPFVTNANLIAPIMMIAEKTADEIIKDYS